MCIDGIHTLLIFPDYNANFPAYLASQIDEQCRTVINSNP